MMWLFLYIPIVLAATPTINNALKVAPAPLARVAGCLGNEYEISKCELLERWLPDGLPDVATPTVHILWYGTWSQNSKDLIRYAFRNVGGSSYLRILTTYQLGGVNFSGQVKWGDEKEVNNKTNGFQKLFSTTSALANEVTNRWTTANPNGVYLMFISLDVEVNFATPFCAFGQEIGRYRIVFTREDYRCLKPGPNSNAVVDAVIFYSMKWFIRSFTSSINNLGFYTSSQICDRATNVPYIPRNGGFYTVKLGTNYYYLGSLVEFRVNGQFCATSVFCSDVRSNFHCLSLYDHLGDNKNTVVKDPRALVLLATDEISDLAKTCFRDRTCLGFNSVGLFKAAVTSANASSSYLDLYVRKCVCAKCGSSTPTDDFATCGPANSTCGSSSRPNAGCWAKFASDTETSARCLCIDQTAHGVQCQDAIPLKSGVPLVASNVATALSAPTRKNCMSAGHTLHFNLSTQPGMTCEVHTCGSRVGLVLAAYRDCKDGSEPIACEDANFDCPSENESEESESATRIVFAASQPWHIVTVGSAFGQFAGQFQVTASCSLASAERALSPKLSLSGDTSVLKHQEPSSNLDLLRLSSANVGFDSSVFLSPSLPPTFAPTPAESPTNSKGFP